MKFSIRLLNIRFNFSFYIVPKTITYGVFNRIKNTPYRVLFIDYDSTPLEWVIEECRFLIRKFKLGDFIILESSKNSYHVLCFDVLSAKEETLILNDCSCDEMFKFSGNFDHRSKVLRISSKGKTYKPVFKYIIKSQFEGQHKKSLGHIMLYKDLFNIPFSKLNDDTVFSSWAEPLISGEKEVLYTVSSIKYPTRKNV